jgi:hypothetical protein
VVPGKRHISWDLPGPAGRPLAAVETIRDDVARRVDELVAEVNGPPTENRV